MKQQTKDELVKEMISRVKPGTDQKHNFIIAFEFFAEKIAELQNVVNAQRVVIDNNKVKIKCLQTDVAQQKASLTNTDSGVSIIYSEKHKVYLVLYVLNGKPTLLTSRDYVAWIEQTLPWKEYK